MDKLLNHVKSYRHVLLARGLPKPQHVIVLAHDRHVLLRKETWIALYLVNA